MSLAAEQLSVRPETFDRQARIRTDTITWAAEVLNGSMRTSFEYDFNGVDLIGEDGGSVTEIFDDAITSAETIVAGNPSLLFELRRRYLERGELEDMLTMMRGELPNTMIVVSDFPPELMAATEDISGYNARRRQTMLRVITRQSDGKLRMVTQSLDGSNRQALEAIYHQMGYEPQAGELLGQRIHRHIPEAWQEQITDNLTEVHDNSLTAQFGDSWHAGLRKDDSRQHMDTYQFAVLQTDLIDWFSALKQHDSTYAETMRLGLAAAMTYRYEAYKRGGSSMSETPSQQSKMKVGGSALGIEIIQSMRRAVAEGASFSACGVTAKSGLSSLKNSLKDAGYGNQAEGENEDEESGACDYVHDGCYCCDYYDDGTKRGQKLVVKAYRDEDGVAHCLRNGCNAWLSSTGSGDIGDIARRAEALGLR